MKYILMVLFLIGCQKTGPMGPPGLSGAGCTVEQLDNGALIECGANSAVILNGLDGNSELTGFIGISEVLNPCEESDQVLLKLSTGQVLGLLDGGPHKDRLVLLVPGKVYKTNDSVSCEYSVDSEGNLN